MTPIELRALIGASGLSNSEFARRLGMNPRNLRKILADEIGIRPTTVTAIHAMLGGGSNTNLADLRDEWIIGKGPPPTQHKYVIHTRAPRFIAHVVPLEPGEEIAGDGEVVSEIAWIDPAPQDPIALRQLIGRATDQLDWDAA